MVADDDHLFCLVDRNQQLADQGLTRLIYDDKIKLRTCQAIFPAYQTYAGSPYDLKTFQQTFSHYVRIFVCFNDFKPFSSQSQGQRIIQIILLQGFGIILPLALKRQAC